jgi:hypothetical protein
MHSSKAQLQALLSRAPVSPEDSQLLVPRLATYFGDIYGKKVFKALCRPLSPQVCVFEPIDTPKIHWSALPITDLVHRLHKLTIEVLSDCIRGLPLKGRPLITCRSRQKTCNGLAIHIRDRVNFLQCIGPSTVCDILLCYLPLSHPCDQLDEEYILQIMSFEYGSAVLEQLGHRTLSQSNQRKITRRERKIELVIEA